MKKIIFLTFFILILIKNLDACFGPELFVGYEKGNGESYVVANLLDVYIKEKTGINVVLKEIEKESTSKLLDKEAVDILTFSFESDKTKKVNLSADKKVSVYYRKKIEEDLRFTSLISALTNLANKFYQKDYNDLKILIEKKGRIKRTIKEYLMDKGIW